MASQIERTPAEVEEGNKREKQSNEYLDDARLPDHEVRYREYSPSTQPSVHVATRAN